MSRHASKRFSSAPERSAGIAPALPLAPVQAHRACELRLAHGFAASLLLFWGVRADPSLAALFAGWVAPGLPKQIRRELSEAIELSEVEGQVISNSPAMLEAATRWYLGLGLPRTRLELWSGPPISDRHWRGDGEHATHHGPGIPT